MTTAFAFLFETQGRERILDRVANLASSLGYTASTSLNELKSRDEDFEVFEGFQTLLASATDQAALFVSSGQDSFGIQSIVWADPSAASKVTRDRFFSFLRKADAEIRLELNSRGSRASAYDLVFAEYWSVDEPIRYMDLHFEAALDFLRGPSSWQQALYDLRDGSVTLHYDSPLILTVRLRSGWNDEQG